MNEWRSVCSPAPFDPGLGERVRHARSTLRREYGLPIRVWKTNARPVRRGYPQLRGAANPVFKPFFWRPRRMTPVRVASAPGRSDRRPPQHYGVAVIPD
jgi:hypothetical protein